MKILNEWRGSITELELENDTMWCRVQDITDPTRNEEWGEFTISEEVSPEEMEYVSLGAIFNWIIEEDEAGKGHSRFVFSKERWTQEELDEAKKEAEELMKSINWFYEKLE